MEKIFIEVKNDRIINIKALSCVYKFTNTDICFEYINGNTLTIEYDNQEERDIDFGIIKNTISECIL